jgi:hypothetical protein
LYYKTLMQGSWSVNPDFGGTNGYLKYWFWNTAVGDTTPVEIGCGSGTSGSCQYEWHDTFSGLNYYQIALKTDIRLAGGMKLTNQSSQVTTWSLYPIQTATQTPMPTGTAQVNYCRSLGGGGSGPGLELPPIVIGPATCASIPAFEIDLSLLPLPDGYKHFTFPGLAICARPIRFGELNILGIHINLDIFAMLMAGVAMFRLFMRS